MKGNPIRRRAVLAAVTVLVLLALGRFLQHPPSVVDVLTGATPKTQTAELADSYLFGARTGSAAADAWNEIAALAAGEDTAAQLSGSVTLTVSSADTAAQKYARGLAKQLEQAGMTCRVETETDIMLRSYAAAGKPELFLLRQEQITDASTQDYQTVTLTDEQMEGMS